jgi:group I intron endonuclease
MNNLPNASGIYAIVHIASGKRYVGSAVNMRDRRSGHLKRLGDGRHHSIYIQRAWNKSGPDAFSINVLELCERDALIAREQFHIDQGADYNIARVAGSQLGYQFTEEQRAKLSASHKGQTPSAANRAAVSAACTGRVYSKETLAKMSAGQKGHIVSEECREKLRAVSKALWMNPEFRAKNSAARTGIPQTAEHSAKISAALLGKPKSHEHRAKIAAANRRRAAVQRIVLGGV